MLKKPTAPQNYLVCKVAKAIDFEFIHDEVAHLYY